MNQYQRLIPLLAPMLLAACGGKGPKLDGPNGPHGGSRAEVIYQSALKLSEQGYCDKAMPLFVCLASQGHGWEVASQRAGQCAPAAAKMWSPPIADDQPIRKDADGKTLPPGEDKKGRFSPEDIDLHYAWSTSPNGIRTEGMRQLRRAADANWPSSQALMVQELSSRGDADSLHAAAIWLQRYDNNPRRKVYGGDDVPIAIRKQLDGVKVSEPDTPWRPAVFAAETGANPACDQLLGMRNARKRPDGVPSTEDDDGLVRLPKQEERLPGEGVEPPSGPPPRR